MVRGGALEGVLRQMDVESPQGFLSPDSPTSILLLANAGYTGKPGSITSHCLRHHLLKDFRVSQTILPLSRPFSFVVFPDHREASRAKAQLEASPESTLCVEFVHFVPPGLCPLVLTEPERIHASVPGLHYIPNFVSADDEVLLLSQISDVQDWVSLNYRRVRHYGYSFDYTNKVTEEEDLNQFPEWTGFVLKRYKEHFPHNLLPNQMTLNSYGPGDGIGPHLDSTDVFETGPILILSLQSDCVMEFKRDNLSEPVHIDLKACSLLVMTGDSRLKWKHAIRTRKMDSIHGETRERSQRTSITFRRVVQTSTTKRMDR